jgi:hypothetical protein
MQKERWGIVKDTFLIAQEEKLKVIKIMFGNTLYNHIRFTVSEPYIFNTKTTYFHKQVVNYRRYGET